MVINVAGPFMQVGWPIVKAALDAGCHYLDTTGEQDWTMAVRDQYGNAFAEKGLLLNPANSYMWAAGAIAAEIVLETGAWTAWISCTRSTTACLPRLPPNPSCGWCATTPPSITWS